MSSVLDSQSRAIPGVLVEIAGASTQSQTTDDKGEAHFLNLAPGKYRVTASLSGFRTFQADNIEVAAGISVPLSIPLSVARRDRGRPGRCRHAGRGSRSPDDHDQHFLRSAAAPAVSP